MTTIAITALSTEQLDGTGAFDVLMRAVKAHLEAEFTAGRIRGPEYAQVYLGSLELAMKTALEFVLQRQVVEATVCKLKAEFDLTVKTTTKTNQETLLLTQKTATEKAQILDIGVDANSVIGKQKALYQAQTDGFKRDAEQKAAKLLADTWSVRRTTDEGTVADGTNMLYDTAIGRAVNKLLAGVGA
jgi:hypothetical protein